MNTNILPKKIIKRVRNLFSRINRNLLVELTRSEFKVTDHNSILGILWSLINPVVMLSTMYFIFRSRFGQKIYAYPLFLLIGIICVNFFISATTCAMKVFSVNRELVLNSTVPREAIVISRLVVRAYKFLIELLLCIGLGIFYGVFSLGSTSLLLLLLCSYIAFIFSFSLFLSVVYCFIRDIEHIWMLISRMLFFITPVFYKLESTSLFFRKFIYWCNPVTTFVVAFQEVIMKGSNINVLNYSFAVVLGCISLILAYTFFLTVENFAVERA